MGFLGVRRFRNTKTMRIAITTNTPSPVPRPTFRPILISLPGDVAGEAGSVLVLVGLVLIVEFALENTKVEDDKGPAVSAGSDGGGFRLVSCKPKRLSRIQSESEMFLM